MAAPAVPRNRRRGPTGYRARTVLALALPVLLLLPGLGFIAAGIAEYWSERQRGVVEQLEALPEPCRASGFAPASLDIPALNVPGSLGPNGTIGAAYEFEPVHFTAEEMGRTVSFPSALAVFPSLPSPSEELFFPRLNATIEGPNWSAPAFANASEVESSPLRFVNGSPAYLSTSRIAVMISGPNDSVEIAIRWHWTTISPTGILVNGPWTVPNATAAPHLPPSILFPAPYVWIVSTSGSDVAVGSNWSARLNGTVEGQSFRISFEWAGNGSEVQSIVETNWPLAHTMNASIQIAAPGVVPLVPGPYLIHIHNACDAILHSLTIEVSTNAPADAATGPATPVSGASRPIR